MGYAICQLTSAVELIRCGSHRKIKRSSILTIYAVIVIHDAFLFLRHSQINLYGLFELSEEAVSAGKLRMRKSVKGVTVIAEKILWE